VTPPRTVVLADVNSRVEAEMMVGMLRSNGVRALVSTDDAGGTEPALQAQGVRVLVAADDAADARRLIGEKAPGAVKLNRLQRWIVRLLSRGDPEAR
jgi:predicted Fe-Mo cluster-binding NifX family protein